MKVDRFDTDVRVEGVLVEENCTTSVMGHVEPITISKNVMIDIFGRLLQVSDMPPAYNLLFEGIFFSASVVDAEPLLRNQSGRKMFVGTVCVRRYVAGLLSDASRKSAVAL